ncbi:SDR family NAD(P)-dependent oxidoreductase [Catenovulum agarivorans]|uniref:SDR family NAD(P)-dependent oxidoreductase n=1 Tax=Catenovulum agarivorans TaxID=1172192 RepID=UPI000317166B|nr:SDR family NAD(P)-dependent oxidoreductase [Catenovulum agarivorans]
MARKTILITGCSSGIGLHCALELDKEGYQVLATARQQQDVEKLKALGLNAYQLDLADPISVEQGFAWAEQQADSNIYALFNNGAYALPGALEDISRAQLRTLFETNVFGWHQLTNLCIEHMLKHKQGRILQNSSVLGLVAMKFRGAYNASKYAIEGLSDTLRLELKDTNIHISLIEPGPILSQFRANALAQFELNIDINQSRFQHTYQKMLERLKKEGPGMAFTEGPESVLKRVRYALSAKQPQARYYVTKPTYFIGFMRRILPTKWLDNLVKSF